jgi:hypothetical protein
VTDAAPAARAAAMAAPRVAPVVTTSSTITTWDPTSETDRAARVILKRMGRL